MNKPFDRVSLLKDSGLQSLLDRQGFVVIDLMDTATAQKLLETFQEFHPVLPQSGFVSDSYLSDATFKKQVSQVISSILAPWFEKTFQNYQSFGGTFLYKIPSTDSHLDAHQDWTIVEEDREYALNCWIPLCDVDEQNGTLFVLPGSHYDGFVSKRAPTLPFFFEGNEDLILRELIPVPLRVGQALLLNQSLIHYSPPNQSDKVRVAITAGVKTKGAPMKFHYRNGSKVEVYAMPEDFLLGFTDFLKEIYEKPKGVLLSSYRYQSPVLSRNKLRSVICTMKSNAGYETVDRGLLSRVWRKVSKS